MFDWNFLSSSDQTLILLRHGQNSYPEIFFLLVSLLSISPDRRMHKDDSIQIDASIEYGGKRHEMPYQSESD